MVTLVHHMSPIGKSHHQLHVRVLSFNYTCYTSDAKAKEDRFAFTKGGYARLRELISEHKWSEEMKDMDTTKA